MFAVKRKNKKAELGNSGDWGGLCFICFLMCFKRKGSISDPHKGRVSSSTQHTGVATKIKTYLRKSDLLQKLHPKKTNMEPKNPCFGTGSQGLPFDYGDCCYLQVGIALLDRRTGGLKSHNKLEVLKNCLDAGKQGLHHLDRCHLEKHRLHWRSHLIL